MKTQDFFKTYECEFNNWNGIPNTWPKDLKVYQGINQIIPDQTNASIQHTLNYAARHMEVGEFYLEIGKYKGATTVGALVGNDRLSITVSDRLWNEGNADKIDWQRNISTYGLTSRTTYVDECTRCFFLNPKMLVPPIGVMLVKNDRTDSKKLFEDLELGLQYLAKNAIIVFDNWNYRVPREVATYLIQKYPNATINFETYTSYLAGSMLSPFWNGVGIVEFIKD